MVPFPKPHVALWGRAVKWGPSWRKEPGPWSLMLSLPAAQTEDVIVPWSLETPKHCPAHPHASDSVRRGGRTHSESLSGAQETIHTVPAHRPGARLPLPLAEAVVGTCPFAHCHGLPPRLLGGTESGCEKSKSRTAERGVIPVPDNHAPGTSPTPSRWDPPPTHTGPRPGAGRVQRTEPT